MGKNDKKRLFLMKNGEKYEEIALFWQKMGKNCSF
jgi:hypothetical protein